VRGRPATYLLALALASGFVDAASYLGLGRVFTANMTGNTVLLGVAIADGSATELERAASALGGFCVGVAIGVLLIGASDRAWPRIAGAAFAFEAAALAALLIAWAAVGADSARLGLIAVSGLAMGTQSAAVRTTRAGGVATTYVTGTLTNAIARATKRLRGIQEAGGGAGLQGGVWAIYSVGAIGGAVTEKAWHAGAIAVPLAIVCLVGAAALAQTSPNTAA
jgi:uncharacterized membrane protein YoaK (UPF0700 family)